LACADPPQSGYTPFRHLDAGRIITDLEPIVRYGMS
jgi:hypothetical protein